MTREQAIKYIKKHYSERKKEFIDDYKEEIGSFWSGYKYISNPEMGKRKWEEWNNKEKKQWIYEDNIKMLMNFQKDDFIYHILAPERKLRVIGYKFKGHFDNCKVCVEHLKDNGGYEKNCYFMDELQKK